MPPVVLFSSSPILEFGSHTSPDGSLGYTGPHTHPLSSHVMARLPCSSVTPTVPDPHDGRVTREPHPVPSVGGLRRVIEWVTTTDVVSWGWSQFRSVSVAGYFGTTRGSCAYGLRGVVGAPTGWWSHTGPVSSWDERVVSFTFRPPYTQVLTVQNSVLVFSGFLATPGSEVSTSL